MCALHSTRSGCLLLLGGVKLNIFLSQCLNKTHLNGFHSCSWKQVWPPPWNRPLFFQLPFWECGILHCQEPNRPHTTWYCVLWLRVISLYLSCMYKYLVRFLSVCSWPVTQIRTVLRLEKDINVTHCIETILLSCKPKFQYTKLWKGDSYAHFTAVWARVIYSSRSLRSHLKPPSFMVGDAQRILQLNEWTFRCTSLEFPFIWPLNVT